MTECKVEWCDRDSKGKTYCSAHYKRLREGRDMNAPLQARNKDALCSEDECDGKAYVKGLCRPHYRTQYEYTTPKRKGAYLKTRRKNAAGYVVYFDPISIHANSKGYVYEHRAVLGDSLGRALLSHESAHHKNGDRSDNRLENLELWSRSQPPGQRVEDKVAWAREILELYG